LFSSFSSFISVGKRNRKGWERRRGIALWRINVIALGQGIFWGKTF
jgi:hypothetical protein